MNLKGLGSFGAKGMYITPTSDLESLNLLGLSNSLTLRHAEIVESVSAIHRELKKLDEIKADLETLVCLPLLLHEHHTETRRLIEIVRGDIKTLEETTEGRFTVLTVRLESRLDEIERQTFEATMIRLWRSTKERIHKLFRRG